MDRGLCRPWLKQEVPPSRTRPQKCTFFPLSSHRSMRIVQILPRNSRKCQCTRPPTCKPPLGCAHLAYLYGMSLHLCYIPISFLIWRCSQHYKAWTTATILRMPKTHVAPSTFLSSRESSRTLLSPTPSLFRSEYNVFLVEYYCTQTGASLND